MKLIQLLLEIDYRTYEAMVKVTFGDEGTNGMHDAFRALPGVTTVTIASEDSDTNTERIKLRLLVRKSRMRPFNH